MFIGSLTAASNQADWTGDGELIDEATGDAISLSAVDEIKIVIRDACSQAAKVTLTYTGGDIILTDSNTKFQWTVLASSMGALDPKTYDVGCIIEQDAQTVQVFICKLAVIDGIVT